MSPLEDLRDPFFLLGRLVLVAEKITRTPLFDSMLTRPRITFHTMFDLLEVNQDHEQYEDGHALLAYIDMALEDLQGGKPDWNYLVWYICREGRVLYRFGYEYQYGIIKKAAPKGG